MKFYDNPKFKIFAIIISVLILILNIYVTINSSGSDTSTGLIFVLISLIILLVLIWDYNSYKKYIDQKKNLTKHDSSKINKSIVKSDELNLNVLGTLALIVGIVLVFFFDYRTNLFINVIGWVNIIIAVIIFINRKIY